jgi:hypothetical protein
MRRRKAKHTLLLWFSLSGLMFLCAAGLPGWITAVDGEPPFFRSGTRPFENIQIVSVLVPADAPDSVEAVEVRYFEPVWSRGAFLEFKVPKDAVFKLMLNRMSFPQCQGTGPRPGSPSVPMDATRYDSGFYGGETYLVSVPAPPFEISVSCPIISNTHSHTFATKSARFRFLGDKDLQLAVPREVRTAVSGYRSAAGMLLDMGSVFGAEKFSFDRGYQEQSLAGFEATRIVPPNVTITASWTDSFSEQYRDIILVLIGTFIGICVTMLIEGLRPVIGKE